MRSIPTRKSSASLFFARRLTGILRLTTSTHTPEVPVWLWIKVTQGGGMIQVRAKPYEGRTQYYPLLLLCLGVVGAAWALHLAHSQAFQPYFGDVNPVLATTFVSLLGVASAAYLNSRRWFAIHSKGEFRRSLIWSVSLATLLVIPVVVVDIFGGFPKDLNVAAPQSLLFYPVMALIAEVAFHVVPLSLLILVLGPLLMRMGRETTLWFCIIAASMIEPSFQVAWGSEKSPLWANAYVGLHVFAFNMLELYLFKRYGFFSMYMFRIIYYAYWHILWGYLRLQLLY